MSATTTKATDAGGGPERQGIVLTALILVAAVANLNLAVANVALPSIGAAFHLALVDGVAADVALRAAVNLVAFDLAHLLTVGPVVALNCASLLTLGLLGALRRFGLALLTRFGALGPFGLCRFAARFAVGIAILSGERRRCNGGKKQEQNRFTHDDIPWRSRWVCRWNVHLIR